MTAADRTVNVYRRLYFGLVSAVLALAAADASIAAEDAAGVADDKDRVRISRTLRNPERAREQYSKLDKSEEFYAALTLSGTRAPPGGQRNANHDFWFYTADVILFNDDDFDGHYWGIDLLFDVDTYYDAADVYAVVYLSFEGGPWNEIAVTDVFSIYDASGGDEYVVVTELVSGYPTGYYDILIELFDAYDGAFLAEYGPADTFELAFLPLEDSHRDDPHHDGIVVVGHGGGSTGWWSITAMLLLLLGPSISNYRKRRQEAPLRDSQCNGARGAHDRAHRSAQ